jgi:hypothetical protein
VSHLHISTHNSATSRILSSTSLSLLFVVILIGAASSDLLGIVFGQTSTPPSNISGDANRIETWVDKLNNIKIQFTYSPTQPIVDKPTELKLNVQNLQTGRPLKDLIGRVVILTNSSGQERTFKFTNISAPDGNFSVKYLFPDSGLYQVISKIDFKNSSALALASFKVNVPLQPFGIIDLNSVNPLVFPALIVGVIGAIALLSFIVIIRKQKK